MGIISIICAGIYAKNRIFLLILKNEAYISLSSVLLRKYDTKHRKLQKRRERYKTGLYGGVAKIPTEITPISHKKYTILG